MIVLQAAGITFVQARATHVHVQDAEKLAKVWLDPVHLAGSTGFAPPELTRIRSLVVEHQEIRLEAWHESGALGRLVLWRIAQPGGSDGAEAPSLRE